MGWMCFIGKTYKNHELIKAIIMLEIISNCCDPNWVGNVGTINFISTIEVLR